MNKIKLLKASPYYNDYLNQFHLQRPYLRDLSYKENYDEIMRDSFASADFWKKNLEKTERFEVMEVIINDEMTQKKWAQENNISYSKENWKLDILEAQIDLFNPNIFFAHDFMTANSEFRLKIKKKLPSITIISWDGVAKKEKSSFIGCDLIMSSAHQILDYYKSHNFRTFYMEQGFEESLISKLSFGDKNIDSSFIGSVFMGEDRHNERIRLISYLLKNKNLRVWTPSLPSIKTLFKKDIKSLIHGNAKNVFIMDILRVRRANEGGLFGITMYQKMTESKIIINSHIGSATNFGGNMRMFEATGVGSCLLTDWKENLKDQFDIDKEIITYKTKEECLSKIKYLLKDDKYRENVAKAGQKRTLENYTLQKRLSTLSDFILNKLF